MHKAIKDGHYRVHPRVWSQINDDFGWKTRDLESFFTKLKRKHFDKQMPMESKPPYDYCGEIPAIYDVYKAEDIMGESIFILMEKGL